MIGNKLEEYRQIETLRREGQIVINLVLWPHRKVLAVAKDSPGSSAIGLPLDDDTILVGSLVLTSGLAFQGGQISDPTAAEALPGKEPWH